MDIATAIAIITVSGMLIGAIVSLVKHFKAPSFSKEILELKKELEDQKMNIALRLAEFESKLSQLDYNSRDIEQLREQLKELERSVEDDLKRFEDKLDRLLELLLKNARH